MTTQHHFVLVPLMAQGHMIPMMDIARLLAARGALVSVITTPLNAAPIRDATDHLHLRISLVELNFPCAEVGLPDGCENLHLLPSVHLSGNFLRGTRLLAPQLESFLLYHQTPATCIITDLCHPWTKPIADKLCIPRLIFNVGCCFFLLCSHIIHGRNLESTITDDMEIFTIPDLPVPIRVTLAQAPVLGGAGALLESTLTALATADGVVMNSFEELEPWVFELYRKAIGKKVWGIGPVSLCNKDVSTMAARGSKPDIDVGACLNWLGTKKESSVLFVCFGSAVNMSPFQLMEVGAGLEAAGGLFIWVIKDVEISSPEMEKWVDDLKRRTEARCLIIRGWAPQAAILSHRAIGGFVTHCGWNSSVEGISEGLPMITWPHFADQFLNERLLVEIMQIGVPIGVEAPIMHEGRKVVGMAEVERAVRVLMDDREDGQRRRERARIYREKARIAMEEGGSSHKNVTDIIEYVSKLGMEDEEGKGK